MINYLNNFEIKSVTPLGSLGLSLFNSAFPSVTEVTYQQLTRGSTQVNYDPTFRKNELINYIPKSANGNCNFDLIKIFKITGTGQSFIPMLYPDLKTIDDTDAGLGGYVFPPINDDPSLGEQYLNTLFPNTINVPQVGNPSVTTTSKCQVLFILPTTELPFSLNKEGEEFAPDSCTILNAPTSQLKFTGEYNLTIDGVPTIISTNPQSGKAIGVFKNIKCEISYTTYDGDNRLINKKDLYVDIYYSTTIKLEIPQHSFNLIYLNENNLIEEFKFGNYVSDYPLNPPAMVIKQNGNSVELAMAFQLLYPAVYYKYENGQLIDFEYFRTINPVSGALFNFEVAKAYNLFPYSGGVSAVNDRLCISRQSLEAVDPKNLNSDTSEILEFDLNLMEGSFYPMTCTSDGAYTVIGGVLTSDLRKLIIFALRNGAGYYSCDITDVLPENADITNFAYQDRKIYLGYVDMDEPVIDAPEILYTIIEVSTPIVRPKRVTYSFNKLNISYLPCQTHCMSKGGIVSKIY